MRDTAIQDYIGKEKEVTAAEVRCMEPGTKVRVHSFDRFGVHQYADMEVAVGTKKYLTMTDFNGVVWTKEIKKESDRICYTIAE